MEITLNLALVIILGIFAIVGFFVFLMCGFVFLVWVIYRERPMQYIKDNSENCPYKIEKD